MIPKLTSLSSVPPKSTGSTSIQRSNAVQFGGKWIAAPASLRKADFSKILEESVIDVSCLQKLTHVTHHNAMPLLPQGNSRRKTSNAGTNDENIQRLTYGSHTEVFLVSGFFNCRWMSGAILYAPRSPIKFPNLVKPDSYLRAADKGWMLPTAAETTLQS